MSPRLAVTIILAVSVGGCESLEYTGVVCTEEFRMSTVTVLDSVNAPVTSATVVSTVPRTGVTLQAGSLALLAAGVYVIVDDASRDKLRQSGDTVAVAITSAKGSASAKYFFTVPSGCHINKVSGPDTLMVQ